MSQYKPEDWPVGPWRDLAKRIDQSGGDCDVLIPLNEQHGARRIYIHGHRAIAGNKADREARERGYAEGAE